MDFRAAVIVALLSCGTSSLVLADTNAAVRILYEHAGLDRIEVNDGRFQYLWHTERKWDDGESAPMRSDLSSYDRHEVAVWLTPTEQARFRQWAQKSQWARFRSPFPPREGAPSYGAAFQSTLRVGSHSLAWTGDNRLPPELTAAVKELEALAREIVRRRERG
jgi:hypothetical protein